MGISSLFIRILWAGCHIMLGRRDLPHARHVLEFFAWPPQFLKARVGGPPTWAATGKRFSRFEVGLFVSREGTPNTVRDTSLGLSALFLCGALCRWTAAAVLRRGGATAGLGGKVVHSSMARIAIFVMRVLAQGLALYAHASLFWCPGCANATSPQRPGAWASLFSLEARALWEEKRRASDITSWHMHTHTRWHISLLSVCCVWENERRRKLSLLVRQAFLSLLRHDLYVTAFLCTLSVRFYQG